VPEKNTHYSATWAQSVVDSYRDCYPRAYQIAVAVLGTCDRDVTSLLQKHPEAWERFKKMVKITNHWLAAYGDLHLRENGSGAFMVDLSKIFAREQLLHKCLVLTDPWKGESIEEHGKTGESRGVVTPPRGIPPLFPVVLGVGGSEMPDGNTTGSMDSGAGAAEYARKGLEQPLEDRP